MRLRIWFFICVMFANCCDTLFTLCATAIGVEEANPIMRTVLGLGDGAFVVVKLLGGSAAIAVAAFKAPRWALGLISAAYAGVLMVHVWGFCQL